MFKMALFVVLLWALVPARACGVVHVRLVADNDTLLAGTPYMGFVELWTDDDAGAECECRLRPEDPCTAYEVRKPSGRMVRICEETLSISVSWWHRGLVIIPEQKRVRIPCCLGMLRGELLFDEVGDYTVSVEVQCGEGVPFAVASEKVVVVRKGRGYDRFVDYLVGRRRELYNPCGWGVGGLADMENARERLGAGSEYVKVLDAIFAYQIGRDAVRALIRSALGKEVADRRSAAEEAERELRLGMDASRRAGVNQAFWSCPASPDGYDLTIRRPLDGTSFRS